MSGKNWHFRPSLPTVDFLHRRCSPNAFRPLYLDCSPPTPAVVAHAQGGLTTLGRQPRVPPSGWMGVWRPELRGHEPRQGAVRRRVLTDHLLPKKPKKNWKRFMVLSDLQSYSRWKVRSCSFATNVPGHARDDLCGFLLECPESSQVLLSQVKTLRLDWFVAS